MVEFKEIFGGKNDVITPFVSKRLFWNHYNSLDLKGFPTRFDAPNGNIIYVYNHVKYLNRSKPVQFKFVPVLCNEEITYYDDEDDFWIYFLSLGLVGFPTESTHNGKTFFYYKEDPLLI